MFNIDFLDNFSHDGPSGARVWLVAGHGSCRVVENNDILPPTPTGLLNSS